MGGVLREVLRRSGKLLGNAATLVDRSSSSSSLSSYPVAFLAQVSLAQDCELFDRFLLAAARWISQCRYGWSCWQAWLRVPPRRRTGMPRPHPRLGRLLGGVRPTEPELAASSREAVSSWPGVRGTHGTSSAAATAVANSADEAGLPGIAKHFATT